jgi:hypothetical protein
MNGGRSVQSDRCKNSMVRHANDAAVSEQLRNLAVNRVWRARRWEVIQQGQELSFAKTEWCLPATSRKWSAVRSVGKVETYSRPLPPTHQVKPWPCSDQKARKTTNMTRFTKSAKPPSPVQIRAAPPNFQFKSAHLFYCRPSGGLQLDYGGLQITGVWLCPLP